MHGLGLCVGESGMVSIGFKALPLRNNKSHNSSQNGLITDEGKTSFTQRRMGRKGSKKDSGFHRNDSNKNESGGGPGPLGSARKFSQNNGGSESQASFVRKQVDPETAKYFSEITNVIEGTEVDAEERSVICGTALEEARGKEVELATDYIISHTMQTLLEGCTLDRLCAFLRSSADEFSQICMDRSGSHVAETALKSLARHLEDDERHSIIEETLSVLCEAIVANPAEIMCNCYGSHVLRRLLCLCKGVPMDSLEFHSTNPSVVLAERLNLRSSHLDTHNVPQNQPFPDQLKFLISEMVDPSREDIAILQTNQYSSLVLQACICYVSILLHRNGVILSVAPDTIYNDIFTKVFKNSLFRLSSHFCGNFVIQALISHARSKEQIKLIFEELGPKFRDLFELGRAGVVAALVAASQRLHENQHECCQTLADAVCSRDESSACIIPRLLFLDNYLYSTDKENWSWPSGFKMHVLGSLMLQTVFKYPSEFIKEYITSITSLEDKHVLEAVKDPAGSRVIEAFLISSISAKQKYKIVAKYVEKLPHLFPYPNPPCFTVLIQCTILTVVRRTFTIEKCFNACNLSMKETIVSELLPFQADLSKSRQGPYLLKKLDVEGFARRPEQWRSRLTSRQSVFNEFYEAFGQKDAKSSRAGNFLSDSYKNTQAEKFKGMRKEIDDGLSSGFVSKSGTPFLAHQGSTKPKKSGDRKSKARGFPQDNDDFSKSKKLKTSKDGESAKNEKKRRKKDGSSESSNKKLKSGISD
ncbi:hypothetical protein SASPL_132278 [Salvia splendens]|uniref:Nucleolar protein 9 n=1 Tax=Salvia splendens TaxID=180675 RepID=A0A8X8ZMF5_SALSN|nr:hypothetical protein SASPL_132278 [Salvia splendens]